MSKKTPFLSQKKFHQCKIYYIHIFCIKKKRRRNKIGEKQRDFICLEIYFFTKIIRKAL